jgi:hypothetical protein
MPELGDGLDFPNGLIQDSSGLPGKRKEEQPLSIWKLEDRPLLVGREKDDRRNKTLCCFRKANDPRGCQQFENEGSFGVLKGPVSQDGEGVTWNWGLCREMFDGTHTILLRAPGTEGPRCIESGAVRTASAWLVSERK